MSRGTLESQLGLGQFCMGWSGPLCGTDPTLSICMVPYLQQADNPKLPHISKMPSGRWNLPRWAHSYVFIQKKANTPALWGLWQPLGWRHSLSLRLKAARIAALIPHLENWKWTDFLSSNLTGSALLSCHIPVCPQSCCTESFHGSVLLLIGFVLN